MAFHVSGVGACEFMRIVFFGNRLLVLQQFKNMEQLFQFLGIVAKPLVILLKPGGWFEFFHKPMDFSIVSIEVISSSGTFLKAPLSASFMAASVTAFGTL